MGYEPWHVEPVGARQMRAGGAPATGGILDQITANERRAAIAEAQGGPLHDANVQLDAQIAMQQRLAAAFGKSTQEIVKQSEQQRLLNQYAADNVEMTPKLAAGIEAYADRYAKASEELRKLNEKQQQLADWANFERETFSGFFSDFGQQIRQGASAFDALKTAGINALGRIADKLMDMATRSLWNKAFEGQSGGLFGMLLGGLTGSNSSKDFSPAGFANGGIMTAYGPMPLNYYAGGGVANSPQVAIFGEGRTPEAYVPLPDGRSIPVSMRTSPAAARPVSFNEAPVSITITGDANNETIAQIRTELEEHRRATRAGFRQVVAGESDRAQNREARAA